MLPRCLPSSDLHPFPESTCRILGPSSCCSPRQYFSHFPEPWPILELINPPSSLPDSSCSTPKRGKGRRKKKKQGGKKTPGITMATRSSLALQNLKVPTPHLSVTFDRAAMTVGITTSYECQLLVERGCASKQVARLMHPPRGRPERRVPPRDALPAGGCVILGSRTVPRAGDGGCLAEPQHARGAQRGHGPTCPGTQPSPEAAGANQPPQVCLSSRSPFPCSLLTHPSFKERPSVALSATRTAEEPPQRAGGTGMHASPRGAAALQGKRATAKPSVPFVPSTAGTSKAAKSHREPCGEEGPRCPTACPHALELRHMGTVAASAGDGLLQRMLKRACQLSLCLVYTLLPVLLCRKKPPEV